jgi:hypothetical protein
MREPTTSLASRMAASQPAGSLSSAAFFFDEDGRVRVERRAR